MTNQQLYLSLGIPMLVNTVLFGILVAHVNTKFEAVDQRFRSMEQRFDKRFDDLRDLWRAELRRVEEVLDARLKHLEER